MKIYKEKLTKEDFKIALSECFKKAWIWHSFENFQQALKWKEKQLFSYHIKEQIDSEADFNHDSSAIDLFSYYGNLENENNQEDLNQFKKNWENIDNFQMVKFNGEAIEDGNEVGERARELYFLINQEKTPNKKIKDFSDITDFNLALTKTQKLFQNQINNYSYLFEPAFSYDQDNLKIRVDILKIKNENHVDIIEIKATSKIKKEHFFDIAYQVFVLEKNGLIVDNVFIGHMRDNFILGVPYNSDDLKLSELSKKMYEETSKIEFLAAKEIVDKLNFNQTFNYETDDIEDHLNYLFEIDEFYKKGNKISSPITLIEAYRLLEKDNYLENLFVYLTNLMAMNFQEVENYFKKQLCETRIKLQVKKNNIVWKKDEQWCFHVVKWFDQDKENIFNFTGASNFSNSKKAEVFWKTGFIYLEDIPSLVQLNAQLSEENKNFFLEHHFRHFDIYQSFAKNPKQFDPVSIINGYQKDIKKILTSYQKYPIYMYDFETAKWAVPRFNFSKSYQQIPFQYSIDVLIDDKFDYKNSEKTIKHFDFLADKQLDPRPEFILHFLRDIFSQGPGIYVAYNDAFEKTVLKYLAWAFPQFKIPLLYIVQNTIDLMNFFKGKKNFQPWFMIYHPLFHGSYSIKKTQPALEPNFSYDDLIINKGDKASQTFREYIDQRIPNEVWENQLRPDMLKYCNRDTLAMVVILQQVKKLYDDWEVINREKI